MVGKRLTLFYTILIYRKSSSASVTLAPKPVKFIIPQQEFYYRYEVQQQTVIFPHWIKHLTLLNKAESV